MIKNFLRLTYLLIFLVVPGCSGAKPTPQASLEQTMGVRIPAAAQNVQIEEQSRSNTKQVWWLKMDAPKDVSEAFLDALKFQATDTGKGEAFDPSLTYENQPPQWWFDGFQEGKSYTTGSSQTSSGADIIGYIDQTNRQTWTIHLDIRQR